jgi:hypothetical protein
VVAEISRKHNHRDTENAEVAQRNLADYNLSMIKPLVGTKASNPVFPEAAEES